MRAGSRRFGKSLSNQGGKGGEYEGEFTALNSNDTWVRIGETTCSTKEGHLMEVRQLLVKQVFPGCNTWYSFSMYYFLLTDCRIHT